MLLLPLLFRFRRRENRLCSRVLLTTYDTIGVPRVCFVLHRDPSALTNYFQFIYLCAIILSSIPLTRLFIQCAVLSLSDVVWKNNWRNAALIVLNLFFFLLSHLIIIISRRCSHVDVIWGERQACERALYFFGSSSLLLTPFVHVCAHQNCCLTHSPAIKLTCNRGTRLSQPHAHINRNQQ